MRALPFGLPMPTTTTGRNIMNEILQKQLSIDNSLYSYTHMELSTHLSIYMYKCMPNCTYIAKNYVICLVAHLPYYCSYYVLCVRTYIFLDFYLTPAFSISASRALIQSRSCCNKNVGNTPQVLRTMWLATLRHANAIAINS